MSRGVSGAQDGFDEADDPIGFPSAAKSGRRAGARALPGGGLVVLALLVGGFAWFDKFKLVHSDNHIADLRNDYGYTFLTYERR